ncbi:oxygenase MpaB family protein [Gordonia sp. NPDC003585]|uniref:oxygenase MpaB family protein n=1 Tax=Gordonia sp. NPDC003585 TaxID=3154275 RepID=UPI0033B5060C
MLNEPVIYLMWPRAALMQLAHDDIAPTEVESGVYGMRGARRWAGTINYLRLATSGDDEVLRPLVREVNRIHADVRVPAGHPDGRRRPAFDPGHQLWVASTWFVSIVDTYQLFVSPLDDDVIEQLYREFLPVGTLLQMKVGDWPVDVAALRSYVAYMEGDYPAHRPRSDPADPPETATPGDVATQVFSTYSLPWRHVRQIPRVRLITWGMAGAQLRSIYGIEWTPAHDVRFRRAVRTVRWKQACWPGPSRRRHGKRKAAKAVTRLKENSVYHDPLNQRSRT